MTAERATAASLASSSSSSRGHLILRSHKPLPRFVCAIPVPHPDTPVFQLRTTVVAILTGQISARSNLSGDKEATKNGSSSKNSSNGVNAPLSYSEHLKQLTIQEWRMKSLVLELKQNALIAPETRESAIDDSSSEGEVEDRMSGFELQDDHECALLEHGDEINLWLKPGQELESLRLPKLSSRHAYGLPNQPLLDRSGTILLGSTNSVDDYAFTSPPLAVREPAEPSSHSSSVSAHPDINFETTNRHWAPTSQHRIVTVGNSNNGVNRNATGNGEGSKISPNATKNKPRRLNSTDYFSSKLVDQKAAEKKQRENFAHHRSNSGPITKITPARTPVDAVHSPLAVSSTTTPKLPQSPPTVSTPLSAPATSPNDQIVAQLKARQAALAKAERQEKEKVRRASMKKMPSDALVVGPGVQGKVGRMNSYDNHKERSSSAAKEEAAATGGDTLGNLDAFVSFTAASTEVNDQNRPHLGKMRRVSQKSGASEERKYEFEPVKRPSDRRRSSSGLLKAERKSSSQQVPTKKASSPVLELLPPMPMPKPVDVSSSPSGSWQDVLRAMNELTAIPLTGSPQIVQDEPAEANLAELAAPAMAISSSNPTTPMEVSTPGESSTTAATSSSTKGLTRAERRYLEVMKSLEAEREKQRLDEVQRREDALKREEEKKKALAIKEEEARRKKEIEKWQIWEEVKARQAKEKEKGYYK